MKYYCIFLLLIFFSCKKKNPAVSENDKRVFTAVPIDTITPNAYLPVYPGSWWKYVNEKGEYTIDTTGNEYVLDAYSYILLGDPKKYTSYPSYVPVYMGRKIWGRLEHRDIHYPYILLKDLIPVVSDSLKVGAQWETYWSGSHTSKVSRVICKDTAIVIEGKTYSPTIVVQLLDQAYSHYSSYGKDYYTKNIGLVRSERMNWSKPDSIISYKNIVVYFINR